MTTFTEIVATVVVHSSAVALSHFGVTLEPERAPPPAAARVVARTRVSQPKVMRLTSCPSGAPPVHVVRT
jgi:hypothetical protein